MRRALLLLVACTPAPGLHLTETPETLARGAMSISVAGGGGAAKETNHCCLGGAARVRYGLGNDQEIGVEGTVIHASGSGDNDASGELQWKASGSARRAVEVGIGAAHYAGMAVGGDLAVLGATDAPRRWQLYGALRATVSEPVSGSVKTLGPTFGAVVPVGVALDLTPMFQIFVEGGGFVGTTSGSDWIGGYGALAITLRP